MDRDGERDRRRRELAFPPEDQYGTGRGQSYRPGKARERTPPPRSDSYRARSPPRRSDYIDTYRGTPRGRSRTPPRRDDFRRRSPTPPRYREREARGGDSYRVRPRSPPRREELPRDDLFRREPTRDLRAEREYREERDYRDERIRDERDRGFGARSPPRYRDRSPVPLKRGRDPSPVASRPRSPPVKRERLDDPPLRSRYDDFPPSRAASPPRRRYTPDPRDRRISPPRAIAREHRPRSRSPPARNEKINPRTLDDWRRPQSPSPPKYARQEYYDETGRDSVATSRRSSPPVHPSRLALQQAADDRSSRPPARDTYDSREPYRSRSPEPPRRRDPSPPVRQREVADERGYENGDDRIAPPREPQRVNDVPASRAPPTGPAGYRPPSTPMAPPTGPATATVSVSAHSRTPVAPPSGPRAAAPLSSTPRGRGGFAGDFRGGRGGLSAPFRGGRGGAASGAGRGQGFASESDYNAGAPPSGPRGSFSGPSQPPAFRPSNNSTATTYPRSQRFAPNGAPIPDTPTAPKAARRPTEPSITVPSAPRTHPSLADLPKIVDGGQKAEPLVDKSRLTKLQEEAEKLRKVIDEKEARKRKGLRDWERLSRETEAAALRSELAEQAVRNLNGEAESQAAF